MAAINENIEMLMKNQLQSGQSPEDLFEQEFIQKRTQLLGDQLRMLSQDCFHACMGASKLSVASTPNEELCLERCEARVAKLKEVVERHVTDSFTPQFFLKYIQE